jgi:tetratricopeptide (TPR) repeat protein/ADP-heptose:LPS heptosyltransferase
MNEAQKIFLAGVAKHNAGQPVEAEAYYDLALSLAPDHYEALHFKGVVALQMGRGDEAVGLVSRAIAIKPDIALFHLNQGIALRSVKRFAEAKNAFSLAIKLQSSDQQAQYLLALTLLDLGAFSEAEAELRIFLARFPKNCEAYFVLGQALFGLLRYAEAEEAFLSALKLNPHYFQAKLALAGALCTEKRHDEAAPLLSQCLAEEPKNAQVHFLRGEILRSSGNYTEAIQAYRQALDLAPEYLNAISSMGNALRELGRLDEALAVQNELIALAPDYSPGYCNRAKIYQLLLNYEAALADFAKTLSIDPKHNEALVLRSALHNEMGNFAHAIADNRSLLAINPNNQNWHFNLSIKLLREGMIAEGFREYEWRFKCNEFIDVEYPGTRWDGKPALDKTLCVYPEQGFGDLIQFARFVSMAAERVGRLILCCSQAIFPIFSRLPGVSHVVPIGTLLPRYDFQISILSLPFVLGIDEQGITPSIPYIEPLPERVALWSERLDIKNDKRPLVGLIWQGNPSYPNDIHRSPPLGAYAQFLRNANCRFIGLQKEHGIEQITNLPEGCVVENIGSQFADFDDTAAVLSQLDLLISSDTSVLNLAGALGCNTWACVQTCFDWRWAAKDNYSLWYPTVRIFHQKHQGDWYELFAEVAEAFSAWINAR